MPSIYFVIDPAYTRHQTGPWHPEQPARVLAIMSALAGAGITHSSNILSPRLAQKTEILLAHSPSYFDLVQHEVEALKGSSRLSELSTGDAAISSHSFEVARLAAGGVLAAVDQIMLAEGSNAFCIVRPPGHHACFARGMGFCLFNNAAIAARYAQKIYGITKVLIADWDVHHGNGTQDIFYQDPSVFYFSTHEMGLYPFTGHAEETGEGLGAGTTMNCPIAPTQTSRLDVIQAFEKQLVKAMEQFQPELVLISAGFDGHEHDPLGHFNLCDEDFFTLTRIVKQIAAKYAKGRLVSILEGGYHLQALVLS